MDADFCAQIIKVIHTQGTPGFPTLLCYDKVGSCHSLLDLDPTQQWCQQLLGDHVKVVIFSCSEYEARNYGLLSCLPTLDHMH